MNTSGMGYKILGERYALLECLAVSGIGEIYRGRDLKLAQTEGAASRILIHLLPKQYQVNNLNSNLEYAQKTTKSLNQPWILAILAQGQTDGRQYFVLHSPDSLGAHSVMSLPSQQLPRLNELMQQFGSLVQAKHLPKIVDSALLISLPNQSLYLLATAFLKPIHALRAHHTGLALYKRTVFKPSLALSSIMAITLTTFAVEHSTTSDTINLLPIQTKAIYLASPQTVLAQAKQTPQTSLNDRPITTNNLALPLTLQEPFAALEPALVALSSTSIQTTATKPLQPIKRSATTSSKPTLASVEIIAERKKTTVKPSLEKGKEKAILAATKPPTPKPSTRETPVVTPTAANEAVYYTANIDKLETTPIVTLPKQAIKQATKPSLAPKPVTLSLEDVIERANKALELENFSEKNGVVFYIRQIKFRDSLHPQIERLGRSVVMYQHEIARNKLKLDAATQAKAILNTSKNLIQEFNLKSLNSAQQVLEHKSNQYNALLIH